MKFGVSPLVLTVTEKDARGGPRGVKTDGPFQRGTRSAALATKKGAGLRVRVRGGRDAQESLPFLSRFRLLLKAKASPEPHAARNLEALPEGEGPAGQPPDPTGDVQVRPRFRTAESTMRSTTHASLGSLEM